ncbi:cGMP-dependent protein kinase, isozyme 1-like [Aphomia sociella]
MVLCPPFKWCWEVRFDLNKAVPEPAIPSARSTFTLKNRPRVLDNSKNNGDDLNRIQSSSKKPSNVSIESNASIKRKVSENNTIEEAGGSVARKTIAQIVHEDPDEQPRQKRKALPPIHTDTSDLQYEKYDKDERSTKQIKDALMENEFLKNYMHDERLNMVTEAMSSQDVPAGNFIIREGESGSHLFVSADGQFEVLKGGQIVKTFGAGVAFGELAILYRAKRFASIRCTTQAKVWTLERRVFQKIMIRSGQQELDDNLRFLASVPFLKSVKQPELVKISECLKREFFSTGTAVVRQGDVGDKFYIIRGGTAAVTKRDGEGEKLVNSLRRGDYFGEQALLRQDQRLATVTAMAPGVECLTLNRLHFIELLGTIEDLINRPLEDQPSHIKNKSQIKSEYQHVELKDLEILGTLGVGGFGRVELVKYKPDPNITFALKCLKKIDMVQLQQQENVYNEKYIMTVCDSQFICKLYRTFKDKKYIYLLMEPVLGSDVWTILQKRKYFPENVARFMMACVIEAFEYLHSKDIIYRDLKPENLMIHKNGYIKLVDFGLAKQIPPNTKTWSFGGTPEYVAPEIILNRGHDRAVDCWALGVLVYELLVGKPPFRAPGGDHMKTYSLILRGIDDIKFNQRVNNSAKMLITNLCRPIPAERLGYLKGGIADIKSHEWFHRFNWKGLQKTKLKPPLEILVANNSDLSNFETYPKDREPANETSGWDIHF